jgi:starch synthase
VGDITNAIYRSLQLYRQQDRMKAIRKQIMQLDFSWDTSARQYLDVYTSLQA